ncbi:hypothetical protein FPE50_000220 [Salmonella bongori]|uniref:Uncharacterized protein n=1 Tax=Salmonella bongori TaxID=54736 RepID=A0A698VNH3_SALBN|nr:hypothetical protein [Salmonella bongori]EDP8604741.1 hypothetical protein [Salmonella bongori]EDP8650584.1 hypothetical protein [Salmonella bongori]
MTLSAILLMSEIYIRTKKCFFRIRKSRDIAAKQYLQSFCEKTEYPHFYI